MTKLYGFTILRNGSKYDYPFRESLQSLCELCSTVYVALGKSEDETEAALAEFSNLKIIPTVWDENLRKSGLILSVQTNIALDAVRKDHKTGWGIYLQADEILNPADFPQIQADIAAADSQGCDAISFRYLHFWQRYDHIATTRRWYPQEIRAIRLDSELASFGDAQSFRPVKKPFYSDVCVYHYGHVRKPAAYALKRWDFGRWWHNDSELAKMLKKGARRESREKTLSYFGPHPNYMLGRIGDMASKPRKEALVFGKKEDYSPKFLAQVRADLRWTSDLRELFFAKADSTVLLQPIPLWAHLLTLGRYRSQVPRRMASPQARPWTKEFSAILRFSEKGIAVH